MRTGRPQHLYFVLHVHAAYFGVLAASEVTALLHNNGVDAVLSVVRVVAVPVYVAIALRTVYGGGWGVTSARTAFVLVTYGVVVIASIAALFLGVLFV